MLDFIKTVNPFKGPANFLRVIKSKEEFESILPPGGGLGCVEDEEQIVEPAIDMGHSVISDMGGTFEGSAMFPLHHYIDLVRDYGVSEIRAETPAENRPEPKRTPVSHVKGSTIRLIKGENQQEEIEFSDMPSDARLTMGYNGNLTLNLGVVKFI